MNKFSETRTALYNLYRHNDSFEPMNRSLANLPTEQATMVHNDWNAGKARLRRKLNATYCSEAKINPLTEVPLLDIIKALAGYENVPAR